jgi:hypothetical protein
MGEGCTMPNEDGRKTTPSVANEDGGLPEQLQRRKQALERDARGGYPVLANADKSKARQYREDQALRERQRQELLKQADLNGRAITMGRPGQDGAPGKPARIDTRYSLEPEKRPVQAQQANVAPSPAGTLTQSAAKPHARAQADNRQSATEMTEKKVAAASKIASREMTDREVRKIEGVNVSTRPGMKQGFESAKGAGRNGNDGM